LEVEIGGVQVELDGRAVVWGAERTVIVADTHFGKDATARAVGAAVPEGTTRADLGRLDALLDRHGAERVWILGDVFHSQFSAESRTMAALMEWRAARADLEIEIVMGNHDRRAAKLPGRLGMEILPTGTARGPWRLAHEPTEMDDGHVLCGHVHPGVRLAGGARARLTLPCFVAGGRRTILPAFGGMTGAVAQRPLAGERFFVVVGDEVVRVGGHDSPLTRHAKEGRG
jgi:DNA ligase-associated metallophosphoesterase